ncbi:MAG: hypothetical protein ACR2NT_07785 [Acidimicrobiia bacterium]
MFSLSRRSLLVALVATALWALSLPAPAGGNPASADNRVSHHESPTETERTQACLLYQVGNIYECFGSEKELDARLEMLADQPETSALLAQCSTGLRLYDGTGYTGSVLVILDRSLWINLSSYGFDNRTSSYKVGACDSYFAENGSGGGSWYPASATQAWDQASSMQSGWNNRVSSVYQT